MYWNEVSVASDALRAAMQKYWLQCDDAVLRQVRALADLGELRRSSAQQYARTLVERMRQAQQGQGGVNALLHEFSLSSDEGVALMCLAEALLRVPDRLTADALILDKLADADWAAHVGRSDSTFVNASAWALMLTGKTLSYSKLEQADLASILKRTIARLGQPLIRMAMQRAMGIMGQVFVMGRDIGSALQRASALEGQGYRYSYDMLGEGARTRLAAHEYLRAYQEAIEAIGHKHKGCNPQTAAGISVKLSALHPRFESTQRERVLAELVPVLKQLCMQARGCNIGLTVDAEEAARLDLSLDVIQAVFEDADLADWDGFGVAVQAYQKRAPLVIDWLIELARGVGRRIMVRLVKGAYWDSEIKWAQMQGLDGYPVFTRKAATDMCYQACASKLLAARAHVFPQFATHNAWSVAAILALDESRDGFEFQRLHGMGEDLYAQVIKDSGVPCRIYAPVGQHKDLLAYLVRRLLENGANSSFVNNIVDAQVAIEDLIADPVQILDQESCARHPQIPLPKDIYGPRRRNAAGFDLSDAYQLSDIASTARGRVSQEAGQSEQLVHNPANSSDVVGGYCWDSDEDMRAKLETAHGLTAQDWPRQRRSEFLLRLADELEEHTAELIELCIREAGKTLGDAQAEVREAVDFCRYYADQALLLPAGRPLGVVLCISPWNFPLAIFVGQVCGALAAGNVVLAKPAEQTSLIALRTLTLMQASGLPDQRVQCVLAQGARAGGVLVPDPRVKGVLFTGSTQTGRWLFNTLAARADAPVPLVAETGGQNAMIVDSSALPEQVVDDVIRSGFHSAGQRCSALRVLFLQHDIADEMLDMIRGAMDELQIGDPADLQTDVGPVIDQNARQRLLDHVSRLEQAESSARLVNALPEKAEHRGGQFFLPRLYEIEHMHQLQQEVFGPVVHVIRYRADQLQDVLDQINQAGFGLTLGIHSRVTQRAERLARQVDVGNVYINRDMIGAVVGVQPFGGHGLSGTGPKAGGPHYVTNLIRAQAPAHPPPERKCGVLGERQLAGPTGERNIYRIKPRGRIVACYTDDDSIAHCLATIDAALAGGNQLQVFVPAQWHKVAKTHIEPWAEQGAEIEMLDIRRDWSIAQLCSVHTLVLAPSSVMTAEIMRAYSQIDGALPRIVQEIPGPEYWQRFVIEQAITTNTSAAGGNASLMTLQA